MPNWKKVVTSGSNAHLNHITASGNIKTAQLQDTSLTSGRVTFATTNGVLTDSSVLTFDGTKLSSTFLESVRSAVINEDGHSSGDFRVEGVGDTHLLFTDASEAKIAIGTETVGNSKLHIVGDLTTTSHITASGNISASGDGLGHTLGGRVSINYGNGGSMTGSLSNGEGFGEIVEFGILNSTVTKGDVVSYRDTATGWIRADKDTGYQAWSWMGVCIDTAADGSTSLTEPKILLKGVVRLGAGHIADSGGDEGDPVYIQDNGHVTFAAPGTSGDYVRIVGYVIDESQDIIYLDPDKTWVEVA